MCSQLSATSDEIVKIIGRDSRRSHTMALASKTVNERSDHDQSPFLIRLAFCDRGVASSLTVVTQIS